MKKTIVLVLLIALCLFQYMSSLNSGFDPYARSDYSKLRPVKVERVAKGKEESQLANLVREAMSKHLTISIAGQRHSQGGHTYYKDGIVLDMSEYRKILAFDPAEKTIRVQSGATWEDIQKKINPFGLSVKTMQSQNIFTVGGSISVNAHGRDIRNGSLIKSVVSFRLLNADGQIINVSRSENADLFPLVLGGYGLFGVILDVTLSLTDDEVYEVSTDTMTVDAYSRYFQSQVQTNPDIHMHIARISVAPDTFLTEMYATNYKVNRETSLSEVNTLKTKESWVLPTKLMFAVNRTFGWGKNLFWSLQKDYFASHTMLISRNNAMRSESQFMDYSSESNNDLLQEYFIPVDQFAAFLEGMKPILREEDLNLLNITVRYVNKDEEASLSYAKDNMFALVCLFNVPLSPKDQEKVKHGIQRIVDEVIRAGGSYYLPYAPYPSREQFQSVYPKQAVFFQKKEAYDPKHLFMNYFMEDYGTKIIGGTNE